MNVLTDFLLGTGQTCNGLPLIRRGVPTAGQCLEINATVFATHGGAGFSRLEGRMLRSYQRPIRLQSASLFAGDVPVTRNFIKNVDLRRHFLVFEYKLMYNEFR